MVAGRQITAVCMTLCTVQITTTALQIRNGLGSDVVGITLVGVASVVVVMAS